VTQAIACSNDPSNPTAAVDYLVIWSQRWTEDAGVADGYGFQSALPNSPNDLRIPHDDFLLVTEIIYQHKPPVSLTDQSVYDFKETSFNQPRAAGNVTFTPAGNLSWLDPNIRYPLVVGIGSRCLIVRLISSGSRG